MCTHPFRVLPSKSWIQAESGDWPLGLAEGASSCRSGSAKAMMESPDFVAFLPPPPAAITTYCLPLITYTLGVA